MSAFKMVDAKRLREQVLTVHQAIITIGSTSIMVRQRSPAESNPTIPAATKFLWMTHPSFNDLPSFFRNVVVTAMALALDDDGGVDEVPPLLVASSSE